ncbi:hypothetical protein D0Y65_030093 [Glycine soja]|uniref:DUF4219 domain-containing protein n=1 Tax=Glycine soja TaxID=3848 RepID=A0A445I2F3_GLYSO|nr:hypothetical protein D0Y65_030093 [Glycine soja]
MMEEGFAVNKSLMFKGANYDNWKERMIAFFESTHINMWDVVEKGNQIPLDAHKNEIPRDSGRINICPYFFSTLVQEILCCVLYLKKNIPKFTTSKVLNRCGTP